MFNGFSSNARNMLHGENLRIMYINVHFSKYTLVNPSLNQLNNTLYTNRYLRSAR